MKRINILTRYPTPGRTKTRLIPALGKDGAARLQRRMTETVLFNILDKGAWETCLYTDGADAAEFRRWLGPVQIRSQCEQDLGFRMKEAFVESFRSGARQALIVGIDCPLVDSNLIGRAFHGLNTHDMVFGPATDGGYYLIGMREGVVSSAGPVFTDIPWGSGDVLSMTLDRAKAAGLHVQLLEELTDIDTAEELTVWDQVCDRDSVAAAREKVSVIIPTLNEEMHITQTLECVQTGENVDVIVADGGSSDSTLNQVAKAGCVVTSSAAGRGTQMNAGSRMASGEILLFLHADTRLPPGYDTHIRRLLNESPEALGAFRFEVDDPAESYRRLEALVNWRSGVRKLPYGDQALFLRADAFRESGGYRELPIMEDYEFVRRYRRTHPVRLLPVPATTSARRWHQVGLLRTTLLNQLMIIAYHCGVPPAKLADWYRTIRVKTRGKVHNAASDTTHN